MYPRLIARAAAAAALAWPAPAHAQRVLEFAAVLTQPDYPWPVPPDYVIDLESPREFPAHWRATDDPPPVGGAGPVRQDGFAALAAAGSGQFCLDQLWLVQYRLLDRPVLIVDLRAEPHGHVNNMAVTFGDPAELPPDPQKAEAAYLLALKGFGNILLPHYAVAGFHLPAAWEPINLKVAVRRTATPAEMARRARWRYSRIPVRLGTLPSDDAVNRFVALVRRRRDGEWIYIHCDTGRERTTLFLSMLDMIANARDLPADAIVARQSRAAKYDLLGPGGWSASSPLARFLIAFHTYCAEGAPNFPKRWTWNR